MISVYLKIKNMQKENEVWKPVVGYEGRYEVSTKGRVRSLLTGKIMAQRLRRGYYSTGLFKDGKQIGFSIHRLVATSFIPNPTNLPVINHKDENKLNNNVENLEWCTVAYNNTYGTAIERRRENHSGEKHKMFGKHLPKEWREKVCKPLKEYYKTHQNPMLGKTGKLSASSKPIVQLTLDGEYIREWDATSDAKRELGIENITYVLHGKRKQAGGYKWVFKDNYKKIS